MATTSAALASRKAAATDCFGVVAALMHLRPVQCGRRRQRRGWSQCGAAARFASDLVTVAVAGNAAARADSVVAAVSADAAADSDATLVAVAALTALAALAALAGASLVCE